MAILKSFDPANYETKTITLSVSAGSSYTLGDAYTGGGRVVDIWGAEGFSSSVGAKNVDYVLTGIDSRLSTDYGTTYYTVFKSVTITGTVTITYRRYGTYVDAGQINQHETRLGAHDARLTSVESVNTTQNNRLSAIETKNGEQDSSISALESGLADEITARASADTTLQGNIDTHANNTTDAHGATSEATASTMIIRDENARAQVAAGVANLDAVNKAQMEAALEALSLAAGSGNVTTTDTSATDGEIVVESGTTGKAIKKSGTLLSTILNYFNGTNEAESLFSRSARNLYAKTLVTTSPAASQITADFTSYSTAMRYYTIPNGCSDAPFGNTARCIVMGGVTNCKALALKYSSKAISIRNCVSETWDTDWTQITDDAGNPVTAAYDLIINSNAKLATWAAGGSYSRVLVKAGTWTLASGGVDLTAAGTKEIVGEPGSVLAFSSSDAGLYTNGSTTCTITGVTATVAYAGGCAAFRYISSLINCTGKAYTTASGTTARSYRYCQNVVNCGAIADGNSVGYGTGFDGCSYLTNCSVSLTNVAGGSGYNDCESVSGCAAVISGAGTITGFSSCRMLNVCSSVATSTTAGAVASGFMSCQQIVGCRGAGVNSSGTGYGFNACKKCVSNRSPSSTTSTTATYYTSYADAGTAYACADTPNGGWNS